MYPKQNKDVAERLGVHEVTVSRWRIGARTPDRSMMVTIENELAWPVEEQMRAFEQGAYGLAFRQFLETQFGIPNDNEVQLEA